MRIIFAKFAIFLSLKSLSAQETKVRPTLTDGWYTIPISNGNIFHNCYEQAGLDQSLYGCNYEHLVLDEFVCLCRAIHPPQQIIDSGYAEFQKPRGLGETCLGYGKLESEDQVYSVVCEEVDRENDTDELQTCYCKRAGLEDKEISLIPPKIVAPVLADEAIDITPSDLKVSKCTKSLLAKNKPCYFIKLCYFTKGPKNIFNDCQVSCEKAVYEYQPGKCDQKPFNYFPSIDALCKKGRYEMCVSTNRDYPLELNFGPGNEIDIE